jgi:DNA-binding NarL/FixJ family response regulator
MRRVPKTLSDSGRIPLIRVLCVDDHPAVRAGIEAILRTEPGLIPVGAVSNEFELWSALKRTRPHLVLLDFHLDGRNGLLLCHDIKGTFAPPRVVVYSAFTDASLVLPAHLAGADAMVDKTAPPRELFEVLRRVAQGDRALPPVTPGMLSRASDSLPPEDLSVMGMLLEHTPAAEMAAFVDLEPVELSRRVEHIIDALTGGPSLRPAAPHA